MTLREQLFQEILLARQRVYSMGSQTPMDHLDLGNGTDLFIKREDLSPIHAYKWRGACNRMSILTADERSRGVVAASAGNHAQGVALAAAKLGIYADIFMPLATPEMKQKAVKKYGGDWVEIRLIGDSFDIAAAEAEAFCKANQSVLVHPYDDLAVIGGQGTLADEVVMSGKGPFDTVLIPIGGGGMAAGVACWLKAYMPEIEVIGVEGEYQASMALAVEQGKPTALDYVDVFCDGTAVRKAGAITHPLCAELVDRFTTVTNNEVCAAIQFLWETCRIIPEPSGALGVAAALKMRASLKGKKVLTILCGGNMDFGLLSWIVRHAGIGASKRAYYRFHIKEQSGELFNLLQLLRARVNIVEFQHGKCHEDHAIPVIGMEASPEVFKAIEKELTDSGVTFEEVTGHEDVEFRMIPFRSELFQLPYFVKVEFPERAGALYDFLASTHKEAGICYFSYQTTGERVGRALLGFEFRNEEDRERFIKYLEEGSHQLRSVTPIPIKSIAAMSIDGS